MTVRFVGAVPPGVPRTMVVRLRSDTSVRELLEEVSGRGGPKLRRSMWATDGRLEESVLVAVDGDIVDRDRLDVPVAASGTAAEVSVFVIRSIFGG